MILHIAVVHDPRLFRFGLWVFVHISIIELMGHNPIYGQRESGKDPTSPMTNPYTIRNKKDKIRCLIINFD